MADPLSSELLGYDSGARVLLVNADDFGMRPSVDLGILDALDHGIVRSTSAMTVCPGSRSALEALSRRPGTAVGVHLSLVRDRPADDWRPNAGVDRVRSLVDEKGRLFLQSRRAELLRTARIDEVEIKYRAQIAAVRRTGISPTHLDFHSLADGGRADVFDVAAGLAAEHGCALRVWLEPNRTRARAADLPVVDHPFLDSFTLDPTARAEHYERLLRDLPAGLTEWAVHPASDDDVARDDEHDRRVRVGDHRWLTSSRARDVIAEEGIDLVGFDAAQAVWRDRHRVLPRS